MPDNRTQPVTPEPEQTPGWTPDAPADLDQTRRGDFIQELLDSGKKSGAYLDARTMKLPTIPSSRPAQPEPTPPENVPEATARFDPVQLPPDAPAAPEPPAASEDEELDAFFRDSVTVDPITELEHKYDPDAVDRLLDGEPDDPMEEYDDFDDLRDLRSAPPADTGEEDLVPELGGGLLVPALKTTLYLISVLLLAVLLAVLVWLAADDIFGLTGEDQVATVTISETDDVSAVAEKLQDAGLIKYKTLFRIYCALTGAERKIDPGIYELNDYYDYMALVNGMIETSGARKTVTVTVPEGYEVSQILRLLADNGSADYDDLCDTAANYDFDYEFLAGVPTGDINRLEGYLFPDTYEFYVNDDAVTVLNKFLRNFDNKLTADLYDQLEVLNARLAARGMDEPLTMRDVLTVASMIEKEAATSGERTRIASVIYNRLCSNNFPYLQIDATVQYALGERKTTLTYEDLNVDSPYNTYRTEGLPPGPIACPGLSCIKAALYPSDTSYYYYALDVDGTHHFSTTLQEHETFLASLEEEP